MFAARRWPAPFPPASLTEKRTLHQVQDRWYRMEQSFPAHNRLFSAAAGPTGRPFRRLRQRDRLAFFPLCRDLM